jgi:hypothetical protein
MEEERDRGGGGGGPGGGIKSEPMDFEFSDGSGYAVRKIKHFSWYFRFSVYKPLPGFLT